MPDGDDNYEALKNRKREEPDVLTKQQINQGLMDIEDMMPLRDLAKWRHILPCCKCFCGKANTNPRFQDSIKGTLRAAMGIKMPESEEALAKNPYLILGFGINAYFDLQATMAFMFATVTFFFLPVFFWYKKNPANALETESFNPMTRLQSYSLGNMAGAQVVCTQRKLDALSMSFECPPGTDIDYNNVIYGIMSPQLDLAYYCTEAAIRASAKNDDVDKCTAHMNWQFVQTQLLQCKDAFEHHPKDHAACSISFNTNVMNADGSVRTENGENVTTMNMYSSQSPTAGQCTDKAQFYLQAPCKIRQRHLPIDDEDYDITEHLPNMQKRQLYGLMVGCLGVFVYMYTIVYIDYTKQVQKNKFLDFDVKTITAGDYSVEFDIDEDVYKKFKEFYLKEDNPISEMAQFKIYVQQKLEERISSMADLGFDGPWQGPGQKRIKIAQITFAFFNEDIIKKLTKRGTFIKTEKWDKLDEINDQIDDLLKQKKILDKLQMPCSVFATFETEEGLNRATMLNDEIEAGNLPKSFGILFGKEIEIQAASEPTDIIWENRHFKPFTRKWKRCVVYFIILCVLFCSGTFIYICQVMSTGLKTKYPKTNCESTAADYGYEWGDITASDFETSPAKFSKNALKRDAVTEFFQQTLLQSEDRKTHYTFLVQCFCKFQAADGVPNSEIYNNPNFQEGVDDAATQKEAAVCGIYNSDVATGKGLSIFITIIIIVFNRIIRTIIISSVSWIGEDTHSQQLSSITNAVFAAQFFNTGLLLTLVNANLSEHWPYFITKYLTGAHYDYSQDWYSAVGSKIVQTMFINAFISPFIGLGVSTMVPKVKRCRDNGNPRKTKKTSLAAFKTLWAGGDYILHFKYSAILNVCFVTFLYGMGLPALFPIAAFNFINQFSVERFIVARYMKQPAALDNTLTDNAIEMLRLAPLLFLCNGYWMLSNMQIFKNVWSYIPDSSMPMKSHHYPEFTINWATPCLCFASFAIALLILQRTIPESLQKWGFTMAERELKVDEDLPNFFESIKLVDADELIQENNNMQNNFGFQPNDPDTIEVLDATAVPDKAMQGTPWYQVSSNFRYEEAFNYIGAHVQEREKLLEDGYSDEYVSKKKGAEMTDICKRTRWEQSDMVMICLNLAYVPDEVCEKINFRPGWQKEFKENMEQFKRNWTARTGKQWEFQNARLEKEYMQYISDRNDQDPTILKNRQIDQEEGFQDYLDRVENHKKGSHQRVPITVRESQENSPFNHEDEYLEAMEKADQKKNAKRKKPDFGNKGGKNKAKKSVKKHANKTGTKKAQNNSIQ